MQFKSFNIEKEGDNYYLTRKEYPRAKIHVTHTNELPDIKDLQILDDCSAKEVRQILVMVEEFLHSLKT